MPLRDSVCEPDKFFSADFFTFVWSVWSDRQDFCLYSFYKTRRINTTVSEIIFTDMDPSRLLPADLFNLISNGKIAHACDDQEQQQNEDPPYASHIGQFVRKAERSGRASPIQEEVGINLPFRKLPSVCISDPDTTQMNAELRSDVAIPRTAMQAQANRASGWVNMRINPSKKTSRVQTCPDGAQLIATAETTNWYRVTDPSTGNSGYIRKDFLKMVPVEQPAVDEATRIGTLNVNGEFLLHGKIPDGYRLQVISARNTKIIAALIAEDESRPQMLLTIAFDEMFADVERMNDLSAEEIEALKATFTDMNEVEFSEAETAAGTKLLIARETGSDEDFVSIISLYRGYSVEFVLSPNPNAAEQKLTDAQIQAGISFLSNLEFIPAN